MAFFYGLEPLWKSTCRFTKWITWDRFDWKKLDLLLSPRVWKIPVTTHPLMPWTHWKQKCHQLYPKVSRVYSQNRRWDLMLWFQYQDRLRNHGNLYGSKGSTWDSFVGAVSHTWPWEKLWFRISCGHGLDSPKPWPWEILNGYLEDWSRRIV